MSEAFALTDETAVALVTAAVTAAGPCPPGAGSQAWERHVQERAFGLLRIVPELKSRSQVLAACKGVTGMLISVEEIKGRGVLTSHATMGTPQRNQQVSQDGRGIENFRTDFLNEPKGRAMFDLARSLVGQHCRFGKRVEEYVDAKGLAAKVSMVEWIEDLGADPGADASGTPAQAPQRPTAARPPQRQERPADPEGWFKANGWTDKADHDSMRADVTETLGSCHESVKAAFRVWMDGYAPPIVWGAAWPYEQAEAMRAKLIELMDEYDSTREPVSVGVDDATFGGYSDEPF